MKEFESIFDKGLNSGLRRFSTNPRNKQDLVDCHNWMPFPDGLKVNETIVLVGSDEDAHLLMEDGDDLLMEDGFRIII